MYHPTDRMAHTTAFVTPVVEHWLEREIAQWVHSMKDRSDDPLHHERTLLPRSYMEGRKEGRKCYIYDIQHIYGYMAMDQATAVAQWCKCLSNEWSVRDQSLSVNQWWCFCFSPIKIFLM